MTPNRAPCHPSHPHPPNHHSPTLLLPLTLSTRAKHPPHPNKDSAIVVQAGEGAQLSLERVPVLGRVSC